MSSIFPHDLNLTVPDAPGCLPGCVIDHTEDKDLGAVYCRTRPAWVSATTDLTGQVVGIEVATDRTIGDPSISVPHQVTIEVQDRYLSLTLTAGHDLAIALLARVDLVGRRS